VLHDAVHMTRYKVKIMKPSKLEMLLVSHSLFSTIYNMNLIGLDFWYWYLVSCDFERGRKLLCEVSAITSTWADFSVHFFCDIVALEQMIIVGWLWK